MDPRVSTSQANRGKGKSVIQDAGASRNRDPNFITSEALTLIEVVHDFVKQTNRKGTNNMNKKEWDQIRRKYNDITGQSRDNKTLKGKFGSLKKHYKKLLSLLERSGGWTWNAENHTASAPDYIWDEIIQSDPKMAYYKNKSFPWFKLMEELVGATGMATGAAHVSSIPDENPIDVDEDRMSHASGTGSSNPDDNDGGQGGEEAQNNTRSASMRNNMEDSVQQGRRAGNTSGSGKRKSGENSTMPSRSQRAKRGITERSRSSVDYSEDVRTMAKASQEMVGILAKQTDREGEIGAALYDKVKEYVPQYPMVIRLLQILGGDHIQRGAFMREQDPRNIMQFIKYHIPEFQNPYDNPPENVPNFNPHEPQMPSQPQASFMGGFVPRFGTPGFGHPFGGYPPNDPQNPPGNIPPAWGNFHHRNP